MATKSKTTATKKNRLVLFPEVKVKGNDIFIDEDAKSSVMQRALRISKYYQLPLEIVLTFSDKTIKNRIYGDDVNILILVLQSGYGIPANWSTIMACKKLTRLFEHFGIPEDNTEMRLDILLWVASMRWQHRRLTDEIPFSYCYPASQAAATYGSGFCISRHDH